MKINLESTTHIVEVNGVPARIWEGTTESGIPVHAYITRLAVDKDEPRHEEFARELETCREPSIVIPLRLIL